MKNIILIAVLILFGTMGFAQIKVVGPNGHTKIGDTSVDPTEKLDVAGNLKVRGSKISFGQDAGTADANILIGGDRLADGKATFTLLSDVSSYPDWGTRMFRNNVGAAGFQHRGNRTLQFSTLDNANISFFTNSTLRMVIRNNGQVDISGAATVNGGISVTSDRRLKSDIESFNKGINELMELNPVIYRYNGQGGTTKGRKFIGLIAQELQEVIPEFVSEHTYNNLDIEGNLKTSEEFLKIHDSELKYLIINAVKEQQEIIIEQEALISEQSKLLEQLVEEVNSIKKEMQLSDQSNAETDIQLANPNSIYISQNYPNPFYASTKIDYSIPSNTLQAEINFYSIDGKLLKSTPIEAGSGSINVNTNELSSGIYSYQMIVDGKIVSTMKMIKS